MAKTKHLYFCSGAADDTGGTEEIIMVPANNVSHWEVSGTASLDCYFTTAVAQEGGTQTGTDRSTVRLVVTAGSGNMKTVLQSITAKINQHPNSDGFIVIADDENSVYCDPLITGVNQITVIDAS